MKFVIAGIGVELETEFPVRMTEGFLPFLAEAWPEDCGTRYRICCRRTDRLRVPEGRPAVCTRDFTVYEESPGVFIRVYRDGKDNRNYAVSRLDPEENTVRITCLADAERSFSEIGNTFFHIEWERLLIRESRILLHASCVQSRDAGGILFSGPSGAGKSTQAELWRRYGGAVMLNGDRTILSRKENGWRAYGSPYAGSSRCYVNADCSAEALVFVKKAPVCGLRRMGAPEAFRRMFAGLTVNSWDRAFVERACAMTEQLVSELPVYEMACTPDRRAVEMLHRELRKGLR